MFKKKTQYEEDQLPNNNFHQCISFYFLSAQYLTMDNFIKTFVLFLNLQSLLNKSHSAFDRTHC
jgi:hypothetical protein